VATSLERGKTAEVTVGEDYGKFVEYGTYKMAAQPFLTPAFEKHAHELAAKIIVPFH
jgi:HK97 gp10 family phage protein